MTILIGPGQVSVSGELQSRAEPVIDGSIGGTEYEDSINVDEGKFELFWTTTGADIYIGMRAEVTGWISLGLDPVNIMTNSDMIFGGVSGGTPYIIDAWCTDDEGNHPEDTTFTGGSYDIDSYDATEGAGTTTVEFKRAMSTGDPYDKKFVNGTSIKVMWATHNDDDDWSNAKHDDADYTTIKMDGTPPPPPPASKDLDGVITAGEYKNSTTYNSGAFQLYWNVSGPNITIALKAQVTGWISLGISPVSMMMGADFIIGGYSTKPYAEDHYAATTTSHSADVDIGGTDDLRSYNATESGGWTTLEVKRALTTTDTKDKPIHIGLPAMTILWGVSSSDDMSAVHTARGSGTWRVENGSAPPPPPPPPPRSDFDGMVSSGEYSNVTKANNDKFELHWNLNVTSIDIAIRAQVTGYVSIGIDPTPFQQMKDADMIFGWVSGGSAHAEDHFANGLTTHMNDLDLGGSFDIISFNGTETGIWTTFEFRRNLTTSDTYDKPIKTDKAMTIIWAVSSSDDTAAAHTSVERGSFTWNLSKTAPPPPPPPPPPPHKSAFDGIISAGEYTNFTSYDSGKFELHWNLSTTTVQLALKAQVTGWVSLGIDPSSQMQGADFIIGGKGAKDAYAEDHFGYSPTSHAKDTDLGGMDDIMDYNATETGGWTTLETKRNLSASDAYDKPIKTKELMTIIWAYSDSDDPIAKHTKTGVATWNLNTSVTPPPPPPPPPPKNSTIDGIVTVGEYDDDVSFAGGSFVVYWTVNGTNITLAMVGRAEGYVSIGFEPTRYMKDADMIFGWVEANGVMVTDAYCTGDFGPHPRDTDLGGSYDILTFNGTQVNGITTIEFVRKLDTGDQCDKPIPAEGSLDILWAISDSDDPESTHTERGAGTLFLYTDVPHSTSGIDGKISAGEYKESATYDFDNFRVYWTIASENITMAISAKTVGWVSIGLDPQDRMLNADIILGWVELGKPHIVDAFSTGALGPHPPDTYLGGTTDIHKFNGTEIDGVTTIEFVRKVSTGDAYDKNIPSSGNLNIIWAYGPTDDFTETHSESGYGVLTIAPGGNGGGDKPDLDGIIAQNEYSFNGSFGGGLVEVHWKVEGDDINIAMVGKTTGWVSIGIGYSTAMKDSDMIFGWVRTDGTVQVVDTYSTGPNGPHPPDTEQGGTNDITSFGGKEVNGITTIEFVRKLDTGDTKDNPIPRNGTVKILWAVGGSDSLDSMHDRSKAGYGEMNIVSGETTSKDPVVLWPFHAVFMTLGSAGMIAAWVAQRRKKWKPFMKFHMWVMVGAVTSGAIGLVIGYIMIEEGTGIHLRVLHSWLGVVAIVVAFTALGLALFFKYTKIMKAKRPTLKVHKHAGRAGVSLFFGTVVLGMVQALFIARYEPSLWLSAVNGVMILALIGIIVYIVLKGKATPPKPTPPPVEPPENAATPQVDGPTTEPAGPDPSVDVRKNGADKTLSHEIEPVENDTAVTAGPAEKSEVPGPPKAP